MALMKWKKLLYALIGLATVAVLIFLILPAAVSVEVASITAGPLQVTVEEDGETRAHDRYEVSAPVAGRVARIELHEGDSVARGQVVAELWPLSLSAREREEQLARIAAAEALAREASERVRHAQADYDQAGRERQRMDKLVAGGFISKQEAEQAHVAEITGANELDAARFRQRSAEADASAARAALLAVDAARGASVKIPVRSPVTGKVLRIPERSERVVVAGASLVILGDPNNLEIVVDLLSTDAVKVKPGMDVLVEGWGGERALRARVRMIEPYGFTKISALGVEEQRVNVIADFMDAPGSLGDAYRVEARIVIWSAAHVLKVPVSALFRHGEAWAVFVVEHGRARRREVKIGQRGALEAEVLEGLTRGQQVIRHPSNDIADGTRVKFD